jgi:hypothetical protein
MVGGTLTLCFEIKTFPSVATVSHRDLQSPATDPVPAPTAPKNIFGDMVNHFVDMKLSSVLIVFRDGEQKCHTFPLAARKALSGYFFLFYLSILTLNPPSCVYYISPPSSSSI